MKELTGGSIMENKYFKNKYDIIFEEELKNVLNSGCDVNENPLFKEAVYSFLLNRVIPCQEKMVDFAEKRKGFYEHYTKVPGDSGFPYASNEEKNCVEAFEIYEDEISVYDTETPGDEKEIFEDKAKEEHDQGWVRCKDCILEYAGDAWTGLFSKLKSGENIGRTRIECFLEKDLDHIIPLIHIYVKNNILRDSVKGCVTWKDLAIFADTINYARLEGPDSVRKCVHNFLYKLGKGGEEEEGAFLKFYYNVDNIRRQDIYSYFEGKYNFGHDIRDTVSVYSDEDDGNSYIEDVADAFNLENISINRILGNPRVNRIFKEALRFNDNDYVIFILSKVVGITQKQYDIGHFSFEECMNAISEINVSCELKKAIINRFIECKHLLEVPLEKEAFTRRASKLTKRLVNRCAR